jgi:hypothetical protein
VDGKNGFFYGIPCNARRVVKFNPIDKSLTEIGPDLGDGGLKWMCGVLANTGSIYCAPYYAHHTFSPRAKSLFISFTDFPTLSSFYKQL